MTEQPAEPPAEGSEPAERSEPAEASQLTEGAQSTGVAAADAALDRLRDAETAPLEEHVQIFDDVHQRLHEGLAELDDER
jgi:hypothetical protein